MSQLDNLNQANFKLKGKASYVFNMIRILTFTKPMRICSQEAWEQSFYKTGRNN